MSETALIERVKAHLEEIKERLDNAPSEPYDYTADIDFVAVEVELILALIEGAKES